MLILLMLFCYGVFLLLPEKQAKAEPMPTQAPTESTLMRNRCKVTTGAERGTVNLRRCAGTGCEVLDIVTEGESLDIVKAGLWNEVITDDGIAGWIKSTYCK